MPAPTLLKPGTETCRIPPYLRNSHCHPEQTRTLSLLEMKRLCTFPNDFRFEGEWFAGYYMMGNAVPPFMVRAIAEAVYESVILPARSGMLLEEAPHA